MTGPRARSVYRRHESPTVLPSLKHRLHQDFRVFAPVSVLDLLRDVQELLGSIAVGIEYGPSAFPDGTGKASPGYISRSLPNLHLCPATLYAPCYNHPWGTEAEGSTVG